MRLFGKSIASWGACQSKPVNLDRFSIFPPVPMARLQALLTAHVLMFASCRSFDATNSSHKGGGGNRGRGGAMKTTRPVGGRAGRGRGPGRPRLLPPAAAGALAALGMWPPVQEPPSSSGDDGATNWPSNVANSSVKAGKMLQCTKCNKHYRNLYSLEHHICQPRLQRKSAHVRIDYVDGVMYYFCSVCNKPFKWLGNLTRHSYVHTGEFVFVKSSPSESAANRVRSPSAKCLFTVSQPNVVCQIFGIDYEKRTRAGVASNLWHAKLTFFHRHSVAFCLES